MRPPKQMKCHRLYHRDYDVRLCHSCSNTPWFRTVCPTYVLPIGTPENTDNVALVMHLSCGFLIYSRTWTEIFLVSANENARRSSSQSRVSIQHTELLSMSELHCVMTCFSRRSNSLCRLLGSSSCSQDGGISLSLSRTEDTRRRAHQCLPGKVRSRWYKFLQEYKLQLVDSDSNIPAGVWNETSDELILTTTFLQEYRLKLVTRVQTETSDELILIAIFLQEYGLQLVTRVRTGTINELILIAIFLQEYGLQQQRVTAKFEPQARMGGPGDILVDRGGLGDILVDRGGLIDILVDRGGLIDILVDRGGLIDILVDRGGLGDILVDRGGLIDILVDRGGLIDILVDRGGLGDILVDRGGLIDILVDRGGLGDILVDRGGLIDILVDRGGLGDILVDRGGF
uniref:Uncharacterized protein n=1 Tax=Timema cristinae TaxID=61476 RepID=A0A7R9DBS4_TIMCR|nr:unnamed protein product [Timema cristinae]